MKNNLYSKFLKESSDEISSLNDIIDEVYHELKDTNLNLPYLDFSDVEYGEYDGKKYIDIPFSSCGGREDIVAEKLKNLLDRFYTQSESDEYTLEVEIDDANEKVSLGIWE